MKRLVFNCVAVAALGVAVAGCVGSTNPPTAGGRRVTYVCERGPGMTIVYAGDVARVEHGSGQTLILQRRKTGDGFWYESPSHRLRGKGNQITFARVWSPLIS